MPLRRLLRARYAIASYVLAISAILLFVNGAAADPGAPSIQSVGITNGQSLSGSVSWTAQVGGSVGHVDFAIDGQTKWTEWLSPYTFNGDGNVLDTTSLANGSHTFTVTVYPTAGKRRTASPVSASVTANVGNGVVAPPPPPPPATPLTSTSAPAISGSPVVGQTLSGSNGTWTGTGPVAYSYQWKRCGATGAACVTVSGASASTYRLASADLGTTIRVTVIASNTAGSASATSASTAAVAAAPSVSPPPGPAPSTLPAVVGAPTIGGSAAVGQTLTASAGTWSGTAPVAFSYQWQKCDATGANCASIAGATATAYVVASSLAGSTIRVSVTASNVVGSAIAQSAATAGVPGAAVATSSFDSQTAYLDAPQPSLANAVVVSSAAAFSTAIANAQAGQTIDVLGNVQIPGEFTGFNRVVAGGTVNVVFEPGAGFTGMAGSNLPAVWIRNSGGWRIWGGTITNPAGNGILVYAMPGPFTWTGFTVSNTGNTCVAVYPIGGNITQLTLKGLAGTASPNLAFDPHAEKGTGIHAWNIADAPGGVVSNSTFAADTVNQATGAAVEIESDRIGGNVTLFARARHVGFALPGTSWTGAAQQQVAGNVVQLWGGSPLGSLDIKYAEGNGIQGRILETDGVNAGANLSQVSLDYGVTSGPILQNPLLGSTAYAVKGGLKLGVSLP